MVIYCMLRVTGTVVDVNRTQTRWKIKFDGKLSQDHDEKWFVISSALLIYFC